MNEMRQASESLLRIVCEKDFFFNWWITKSMSRYASSTKFFHFLSHTHTHTHTHTLSFSLVSISHTSSILFTHSHYLSFQIFFGTKKISHGMLSHLKSFFFFFFSHLKVVPKKFAPKNWCIPSKSFASISCDIHEKKSSSALKWKTFSGCF